MRILTIESTCDETAAAVISDTLEVLGSVVASQDELHKRFGGVVPEIAARSHVERILPVIDEALRRADTSLDELGAIAVVNTPGLVGSLLVGLSAAKAIALARSLPLVAVNHLHAHIFACQMASDEPVFPCVGLVASGGHSSLYRCAGPLEFESLGGTIDDAAGEAFDKVASLLGLGYPGGPAVSRVAESGRRDAYQFPRSFLRDDERLEFSFSGLKTAVRYQVSPPGKTPKTAADLKPGEIADLAASFQEAVVDVLVAKSIAALRHTGIEVLCVGGGVAANRRLRERLEAAAKEHAFRLHVAPLKLCTDNAVMAALAVERLKAGLVENLDLDIISGLVRGK